MENPQTQSTATGSVVSPVDLAAAAERVRDRVATANAGALTRSVTPTGRLARLRGLILLGGVVGKGSLAAVARRSPLDLPLDSGMTGMSLWRRQLGEMNRFCGRPLAGRVIVDRASPIPANDAAVAEPPFTVEVDPLELRGTGGLLHDLLASADDADCYLVASASQLLLDPLEELAAALDAGGGDVALLADADGSTGNLMLISVEVLRELPSVGFVDLKEQGLKTIGLRHEVRVVRRPVHTLSIRTAPEYVGAVRAWQRFRDGEPVEEAPFAEQCWPRLKLIENGAAVADSAVIHDSVVLAGGRVEASAVVVRSVVCPGGVVGRGQRVVNAVVGGAA